MQRLNGYRRRPIRWIEAQVKRKLPPVHRSPNHNVLTCVIVVKRMRKNLLRWLVALMLLLPASFGGFTVSCVAEEESQEIGDAFGNLIGAIEDAF